MSIMPPDPESKTGAHGELREQLGRYLAAWIAGVGDEDWADGDWEAGRESWRQSADLVLAALPALQTLQERLAQVESLANELDQSVRDNPMRGCIESRATRLEVADRLRGILGYWDDWVASSEIDEAPEGNAR